jgi:hypothetical protein
MKRIRLEEGCQGQEGGAGLQASVPVDIGEGEWVEMALASVPVDIGEGEWVEQAFRPLSRSTLQKATGWSSL